MDPEGRGFNFHTQPKKPGLDCLTDNAPPPLACMEGCVCGCVCESVCAGTAVNL